MKKIFSEESNDDSKNLVGTTKILISLLIFCIIFVFSLMVGRYKIEPVQNCTNSENLLADQQGKNLLLRQKH